ncbi:urease accessory protein UreF [Bacillus sp. ISL-34]|uniref:urease accessory protein UreF n=1 Tax=Bacillus sp. ISL-34 TaxID=2819121 RepID=UPI001BE53BC5|nr:urease accessory protein UreF [Bacillus sp. ISL-34]MBT2645596.1 urease accessory protein UreF [Bacillus sp. ISL-34]
MIERLFPLIQLCDSNFPSGSFSHSFGMETYIQEGKLHDGASLKAFLKVYISKSLTYTDGLGCRLAYEFVSSHRAEEIWDLDEKLYAACSARESREASKRIGQQMAKLCSNLYPSEELSAYLKKIQGKQCYGHPAIVFALVCTELNITVEMAIHACLYAGVSSLIQNAVRGIPLGQTAGQSLLLWTHDVIQTAVAFIKGLPEGELGRTLPGLEIAQMRHEQLHVRLFMS